MTRKNWWIALPVIAAGGIVSLWLGRLRQEHGLESLWKELQSPVATEVFDQATVDNLPAPARRYFRHAIAPGTPIARSVRLTMHGSFRLRPDASLVPMHAEQILSPPHGLIWKARMGSGLMRFQGFDRYAKGEGAMRWWLHGLVPLVRAAGPDVSRSAAARVAGESLLIPSALLPQSGVEWEAVNDTTAHVRLKVGEEACRLTLTVDAAGHVERMSLMRRRDNAGNGRPGYVRFGVDQITEERTFDGYTVPTQFRAGWKLGEPDEFPFFFAVIDSASFR